MKVRLDRNKIYLVLVYFSMSFLYLGIVLDDEQDPVPLLGYILGLIVLIVVSYDALLRGISFATGYIGGSDELAYFSAFIDLNNKIHNFLQVDDVLTLVNVTLREKIKVKKIVYLISKEIPVEVSGQSNPSDGSLALSAWPNAQEYEFLDAEFEKTILQMGKAFSFNEAGRVLKKAFKETGTNLAIPITQNDKILCVILINRFDDKKRYSEFEFQMFGYLANQLSIILDRIRVYEKVMQQTQMDHAEKMQVMQSLSANIAHEMRTPLSGIRASISGMETYLPELFESYEYCAEHVPDKFPLIRENHKATLQGTPKRIQLMIDQANTVIDMLLMNLRENSLDQRQLNLCEAKQCIEQAVDRYPFKSGEKEKLELDLDEDFTFLGIESLFIYILFNLLKNAFYSVQSAQNGGISIRIKKGEKMNAVYFRDTGMGIESDIIEKIFDGFFTTKSDGTGVGLAFCKRTILSFGGEIECRSEVGSYAEFVIKLPVFQAQG